MAYKTPQCQLGTLHKEKQFPLDSLGRHIDYLRACKGEFVIWHLMLNDMEVQYGPIVGYMHYIYFTPTAA